MELKELMEAYVKLLNDEERNLVNIAFDELNSSQYEEAAAHFDQLYVKDSNDFMSYYLRAYCKSHCGRRGDVYPDSQKLTSAFELATKKAIDKKTNIELNLSLILHLYEDAMDNLAYNAVEETHIDSNGNTRTTNPDKARIKNGCRNTITTFLSSNAELVKEKDDLKEYALRFYKKYVNVNLKLYGPLIVDLEPSYASTLSQLEKKAKTKKIIIFTIIGIIAAIIIISSIVF